MLCVDLCWRWNVAHFVYSLRSFSYTRFAWHTFWLRMLILSELLTNCRILHIFIISDQNVSLIHSFIHRRERRVVWLSVGLVFSKWNVCVNQFEFCFHRQLRSSLSIILSSCLCLCWFSILLFLLCISLLLISLLMVPLRVLFCGFIVIGVLLFDFLLVYLCLISNELTVSMIQFVTMCTKPRNALVRYHIN